MWITICERVGLSQKPSVGAFRNDPRLSMRARVEPRTLPIIPAKQRKLSYSYPRTSFIL